jgi:glycosyltransferase involved in cell wall biosynthesis
VIFLNEERFLNEAVASVLAQGLRDWELLLVDDGSTDGGTAMAQELAARHAPRVRYLCHPGRANRGMSATRNLGLSHAAGELVGFLDADDAWRPEKLAQQVAVLDAEADAGLVYGRTLIWHSWRSGSQTPDFYYPLGVQPGRLYRPPRLFQLLLENKAQTPTTCNALVRRALFDRVGGFEETFRGMFEDQVFFAKALLHAPAYVDDRTWALYRQHERSHTAVSGSGGGDLRARLVFLRWLRDYLRREKMTDARVELAVRRELLRLRARLAKRALKRRVTAAFGHGTRPGRAT